MGRRGPLPAPVAVQLAHGETRPSRVNYEAPLPRQVLPRKPTGMDPEAHAIWEHVLREMGESGVLTGADRDLLRVYCETMASYVRNSKLLRTSGSAIKGQRAREVVVSPYHRVVRDEREALRLLARDLGLSPAARAALRLDLSAATGDLDMVLGPTPRSLRLVASED